MAKHSQKHDVLSSLKLELCGLFSDDPVMTDRLRPGIGEKSRSDKRMAVSERFLGQFTKTRIIAKDSFGKEREFEVLAILGQPKNVVAETGAFWGLRVEKGDTFLQGGTAGGKTIPDIKVLSGRNASLEGKTLWVEITYNGVVTDGVVVPGVSVTSARCSASSTVGTQIPENSYPTAKSFKGKKIHVEIGRWTKDAFLPAGSGNIEVNFCYQISR